MIYFRTNMEALAARHGFGVDELARRFNLSSDYLNTPTLEDLVSLSASFNRPIDALVSRDLSFLSYVPSALQLVILDVDGTLTDGGMYFTEQGDFFKKYNSKDGIGIKQLMKAGIEVGIISHSHYKKVVMNRAEMLGIRKVYVGMEDKLLILKEWMKEMDIDFPQIAYVGDDVNDLPIIEKAGLSACPADALDEVKARVHIILSKKGGDACVREFCDMVGA